MRCYYGLQRSMNLSSSNNRFTCLCWVWHIKIKFIRNAPNIRFSAIYIIYHQPTLIVLQLTTIYIYMMSHDIWCYMTSHGDCSNSHNTPLYNHAKSSFWCTSFSLVKSPMHLFSQSTIKHAMDISITKVKIFRDLEDILSNPWFPFILALPRFGVS